MYILVIILSLKIKYLSYIQGGTTCNSLCGLFCWSTFSFLHGWQQYSLRSVMYQQISSKDRETGGNLLSNTSKKKTTVTISTRIKTSPKLTKKYVNLEIISRITSNKPSSILMAIKSKERFR